jgi:hypothetical protein
VATVHCKNNDPDLGGLGGSNVRSGPRSRLGDESGPDLIRAPASPTNTLQHRLEQRVAALITPQIPPLISLSGPAEPSIQGSGRSPDGNCAQLQRFAQFDFTARLSTQRITNEEALASRRTIMPSFTGSSAHHWRSRPPQVTPMYLLGCVFARSPSIE